MSQHDRPNFVSFLALLFTGTVCNSMIIPFMAFFIVRGLGQDPWMISVYSVMIICLTITINRFSGRRIDASAAAFPLIAIAATGALMANVALSLSPALWTVLTFGVLGFGTSSSAVATMFSLGGGLAESNGVARSRANAYMRATTSTAWMIGPAISFFVADRFGTTAVFNLCVVLVLVWLALLFATLPKNITAAAKPAPAKDSAQATTNVGLWLAAAYVFGLSSAHSLTFTALPLFYVQEVGLPGYAPGTAFSVKTFVEVLAIFSTPYLITRFGLIKSLFATTLIAVCAILFLASVQTYPQMLAGAALEGLYYGLYASLGISFLQAQAPQTPARATALYWNTLMVSGLLAGPAVGLIAQAHSFQLVIQIASLVAAIAALLLLLSARHAKHDAPQT